MFLYEIFFAFSGTPLLRLDSVLSKGDGWHDSDGSGHRLVRTRRRQTIRRSFRNATSTTHRHVPLLFSLWGVWIADSLLANERRKNFEVEAMESLGGVEGVWRRLESAEVIAKDRARRGALHLSLSSRFAVVPTFNRFKLFHALSDSDTYQDASMDFPPWISKREQQWHVNPCAVVDVQLILRENCRALNPRGYIAPFTNM